MTSVKQFAGSLCLGVLLSVPAITQAASVIVNNENLTVQTPTLATPPGTPLPSGITYRSTGATTSSLKVYTEGFLFCANIGYVPPANPNEFVTTLVSAHESMGSSVHLWEFQSANDVKSIGYRGDSLAVNRSANGVQPSSLTCHGVGASGEVGSGIVEGIFDNPFESATSINYNHLVNWRAPSGFDWATSSNWANVPVDPCASTVNDPAQIEENVACVAATGVRHTPTSTTRSPTMWTATDGTSFTYLFRFDARYGPQQPGLGGSISLPTPEQLNGTSAGESVKFTVREAFDSTYLGSQGAHYCQLTTLPAQLNSSVCTGSISNPLPVAFEISLNDTTPTQSVYVAVTRPIHGAPPSLTTPVVGVAVFVDPVVSDSTIGGDNFSGDNVVFGFMPASSGFPWMIGQ